MRVDFTAASVLGAVRRVIVERDNLFGTVIGFRDVPRVMLEAELHVVAELEVGFCAAEAPDDFAGGAVDFVHGAGVARGDEVVALAVFVNGVDVEVVPGVGGVVA